MAEFRRRVSAWRELLQNRTGNRVAIYCNDALTFAEALFGAWHAGKEVVLPGDALPATLQRLAGHIDDCIGDLPDSLRVPEIADGDTSFAELDVDTRELTLFTSGSSGEPVAIRKHLRQLEAEIRALESCFGAELGDASVAGTVSQQHIYGLLFRVLWPLASGRAFHADRLATPEQIAALRGSGACALVATPAHLKRLSAAIDWRPLQARLCCVFSSGGPLPAEASQSVTDLWHRRPIEVFGSTETGGIASRAAPDDEWKALPGVEWRVVDEHLQVRSPHLRDDVWFACADRARVRGEGFELLGRSDRIAKIEERRISLSAIEQAALASGCLREAKALVLAGARARIAVVAVPSAEGAQMIEREGRRAFIQHLRTVLAATVDSVALPRHWRFVDAMPSNAQGKSPESLLADLFGKLVPPSHWRARNAHDAEIELDIAADLAVFDGHFPGTPVVPGVALVDWAIRFGRQAFAMPESFLRADVLKFQALVRPDTRLALRLEWRADTRTLGFRYDSAHGPHASGRLLFVEDAA